MAGWVPGQRVWAWCGLEEGENTCWTRSSCPSSGSLKWLPPCLEPARPVGPPGGRATGALAVASARERGPSGPGWGRGQWAMLPPGLILQCLKTFLLVPACGEVLQAWQQVEAWDASRLSMWAVTWAGRAGHTELPFLCGDLALVAQSSPLGRVTQHPRVASSCHHQHGAALSPSLPATTSSPGLRDICRL